MKTSNLFRATAMAVVQLVRSLALLSLMAFPACLWAQGPHAILGVKGVPGDRASLSGSRAALFFNNASTTVRSQFMTGDANQSHDHPTAGAVSGPRDKRRAMAPLRAMASFNCFP